jgi:hypothetical protein
MGSQVGARRSTDVGDRGVPYDRLGFNRCNPGSSTWSWLGVWMCFHSANHHSWRLLPKQFARTPARLQAGHSAATTIS